MKLKLIQVDRANQLNTCKISILLGVATPENLIHDFLSLVRGILYSPCAILKIHTEPYIWHDSIEGFQACEINASQAIYNGLGAEDILKDDHPNYKKLSDHLTELGFEHQHCMAFELKRDASKSIGQLIVMDTQASQLKSSENIRLIYQSIQGLMQNINLREDYADLKERYEQQSALSFSKTKFLQIIAHDLRAPFHGLLGFSEILAKERDSLDSSAAQNIADYLHDTAQSTYRLLENLLNWAMAEGGHFVYHPINFPVKQASQIVFGVLNTLAIQKNIQLIETVPDDLKVYADINMVTSVIQNLVSNALKFSPVDGTGMVYIEARQLAQHVEICVRDTGLGMSKAQIKDVFQPNLKVSLQGTSGEKGTGLGLVLCKRFVDLNHGEMKVSSKQGQGTTVKVTFPKAYSIQSEQVKH